MDLTPLLNPLLGVIGSILAGCAVVGAKWLLDKSKLNLTDQQRATILGAADTAAGMITMELAKGSMQLTDVHIANPKVQAAAEYVMTAAPVAAKALGITQSTVTEMVVGKVGKALGEDPSVPTVAAPIAPTPLKTAPTLVTT